MILGQEPWRPTNERRIDLHGFDLLERTRLLGCWIANGAEPPQVENRSERWQEIRLPSALVHHVYLSSDSGRERRQLLLALADAVRESSLPILVCGDFNLAPCTNDGWYGEQNSKWTTASEREALGQLIAAGQLVDTTAPSITGRQEFSFERQQGGKMGRFRCDLVLGEDCLCRALDVTYDHGVRSGIDAFTDHSAIVIEFAGGRYADANRFSGGTLGEHLERRGCRTWAIYVNRGDLISQNGYQAKARIPDCTKANRTGHSLRSRREKHP